MKRRMGMWTMTSTFEEEKGKMGSMQNGSKFCMQWVDVKNDYDPIFHIIVPLGTEQTKH